MLAAAAVVSWWSMGSGLMGMGKHRAAGEMEGGGGRDLYVRCFGENMGGHGAIAVRGEIWGRV